MKAAIQAAIQAALDKKLAKEQAKAAKQAALSKVAPPPAIVERDPWDESLSQILKPDSAQVSWETSRREYLLSLGRRDRAEMEGLL